MSTILAIALLAYLFFRHRLWFLTLVVIFNCFAVIGELGRFEGLTFSLFYRCAQLTIWVLLFKLERHRLTRDRRLEAGPNGN